jgi:hypothetical protein
MNGEHSSPLTGSPEQWWRRPSANEAGSSVHRRGFATDIPVESHGSWNRKLQGKQPIMLTSDKRRAQLKRLLDSKRCLRVLEAHSPISALLAQHARFEPTSGQSSVGYDAIWSSSLTDSTHRGLPDNEILTASNRLHNVHDTFEVCSLPMIFDGDTGGKPEHFALHVKAMERAGVSAVDRVPRSGVTQ